MNSIWWKTRKQGVGFRSHCRNNNTRQFLVGWVEERNPTERFGISTQPNIEAKIQLNYDCHILADRTD